ncbi:hypothetical protein PanWU01x14_236750 [Parasponia andersonii]|uniref:Uncharacterized protein n=1 Tax=Parasponia andersonii TaxID=3476 RepID=A0A2P5BI57_PARAD|nr:hypothetical protein PanWU01x14_236750 [Parasponia andersonii]
MARLTSSLGYTMAILVFISIEVAAARNSPDQISYLNNDLNHQEPAAVRTKGNVVDSINNTNDAKYDDNGCHYGCCVPGKYGRGCTSCCSYAGQPVEKETPPN